MNTKMTHPWLTAALLALLVLPVGACAREVDADKPKEAEAPAKPAARGHATPADAPPIPPSKARPADTQTAPATAQVAEGEAIGPPKKTAAEFVPGDGRPFAIVRTNLGDMVLELYEHDAPVTVANFVGLATGQHPWRAPGGKLQQAPLYDGTVFHRVIEGFMIQGGDPSGTGRGGPGYLVPSEETQYHFDAAGRVATANRGRDTNGSQFFITDGAAPHLDRMWKSGGWTIFGQLALGSDVVKKIATVEKGPGDRPVQPVTITKVQIVRAENPPTP